MLYPCAAASVPIHCMHLVVLCTSVPNRAGHNWQVSSQNAEHLPPPQISSPDVTTNTNSNLNILTIL